MFTDLCQKLIKVSKMREPKGSQKKPKRINSSFMSETENNKKKGCCKQ